MKKTLVCDVVDENGKVICMAGKIGDILKKDITGPQTHVRIGYYKDMWDDKTWQCSIYPLSQVYFYEIEDL